MSRTLYAQDTFHLSGIDIIRGGAEIGENIPSGQVKELEAKGLIGPEKPKKPSVKDAKGAPENKAK